MNSKKTTIDLFEIFYNYIVRVADSRGDKNSHFVVWLDNDTVEILGDVLKLLKEQETDWISVDDRLPERDVTVLAVKKLKNGAEDLCLARCIPDWEYTEYPSGEKKRKPYWVCGGNNNIIFWSPLPEIPKAGDP